MAARAEQPSPTGPYAVSVFGGVMTNNSFENILTDNNVRFRQAYLLGIGISRRIGGLATTSISRRSGGVTDGLA